MADALRRVLRYYEPGVPPTVLLIGDFVEPVDLPAGVGWCEALTTTYGPFHCAAYARFERDTHIVTTDGFGKVIERRPYDGGESGGEAE